ncbi:HNH endonuclease [Cyanobium sp. ULC082]
MYKLSLRQARLLRCTAEHLQSRSEGGADSTKNIAAACTYCNGHRHKRKRAPDPSAYRQTVRHRMRKGKWLFAVLPKQFVIREAVSLTTRNT